MIRELLAPARLLALGLAVVFAAGAVLLGNWQFSRHQDRLTDRDRVESHYDAPAGPLAQVVPDPSAPWDPDLEWTRVEVTGRYAVQDRLLVRNRTHRQVVGYAVTVPLVIDDAGRPAGVEQMAAGSALLVDRGWVPNARDAATLPEVPPTPEGAVVVTGWLRPGESSLGREPAPGQLASIDLPQARERTGRPLLDAYLVLEQEVEVGSGRVPERAVPADPPDTGLGPHLAYAVQWWLTAPVGLVLVVLAARRDHLDTLAPREQTRRTPRRRIWDEEDE